MYFIISVNSNSDMNISYAADDDDFRDKKLLEIDYRKRRASSILKGDSYSWKEKVDANVFINASTNLLFDLETHVKKMDSENDNDQFPVLNRFEIKEHAEKTYKLMKQLKQRSLAREKALSLANDSDDDEIIAAYYKMPIPPKKKKLFTSSSGSVSSTLINDDQASPLRKRLQSGVKSSSPNATSRPTDSHTESPVGGVSHKELSKKQSFITKASASNPTASRPAENVPIQGIKRRGSLAGHLNNNKDGFSPVVKDGHGNIYIIFYL